MSALDSEADLTQKARDARGRNWPVAAEAAKLLRDRFPGNQAGYQIGVAAARALEGWSEASAILAEAADKYPGQLWLFVQQASVAQERGDLKEAARLAAALRDKFPCNAAGYRIGAAAARAQRQLDEADAIARDALARFPDEGWPLSLSAQNCGARGDLDRAIEMTAELRARYPTEASGYSLAANWLLERNRLAELETVLREAEPLFSATPWFAFRSKAINSLKVNRSKASALVEALRCANVSTRSSRRQRAATGGKVVVVVGMHRAGTSLCTTIVNRLGFSLGGPLLVGGFDYPDGFQEHKQILDCHLALLAHLDATSHTVWSVRAPPEEGLKSPEALTIVDQLKTIVLDQLRDGGGRWAFKDPRTALFLPLWLNLFDDLGINPIWVLAVRDPRAVAASMYARNRLPIELGELLWVEHYLSALRWLGPQISAVVHYERWFEDGDAQLRHLAGCFEGEIQPDIAELSQSLGRNPKDKNQSSGSYCLDIASEIYSWLLDKNLGTNIQQQAHGYLNLLRSTADKINAQSLIP